MVAERFAGFRCPTLTFSPHRRGTSCPARARRSDPGRAGWRVTERVIRALRTARNRGKSSRRAAPVSLRRTPTTGGDPVLEFVAQRPVILHRRGTGPITPAVSTALPPPKPLPVAIGEVKREQVAASGGVPPILGRPFEFPPIAYESNRASRAVALCSCTCACEELPQMNDHSPAPDPNPRGPKWCEVHVDGKVPRQPHPVLAEPLSVVGLDPACSRIVIHWRSGRPTVSSTAPKRRPSLTDSLRVEALPSVHGPPPMSWSRSSLELYESARGRRPRCVVGARMRAESG